MLGSRLKTIQWPPTELEQQIQHDVDILQTRLPVRPNQRQWPPPPPEYGRKLRKIYQNQYFLFFLKIPNNQNM